MASPLRKARKWWLRGSNTESRTCACGKSSPRKAKSKWAQTKFLTRLRGGHEYGGDKQRLGNRRIDRIGDTADDGCVGKDVPQGGATRSVDRLRISRDAHRAGQRHDHLSDGGELPG